MTDDLELDAVDQRVLGSLMEKQRTVPAGYPMTLNALRTACNQTSSRDPVVDYDEAMLLERMKSLKDRGLVRIVWADRGPRTLKYHQLLDERLDLGEDERALLTVLLLRGAQAPGELRTRTERLHALRGPRRGRGRCCAGWPSGPPRWCTSSSAAPASTTLAGCTSSARSRPARAPWLRPRRASTARACSPRARRRRDAKVRATYDAVATAYAERLAAELDRKPFDRWLLERRGGTGRRPAGGRRGDRTGPRRGVPRRGRGRRQRRGPVAGHGRGGPPAVPRVTFSVGDLTGLLRPPAAAGWGAITAWYALVHLAGSELAPAVASLARVLAPGGWLALALHAGADIHHADELMGEAVDVDFVLHEPDAVVAAVRAAGLVDVEWYLRGPLEGEVETDRLYVLGRRP